MSETLRADCSRCFGLCCVAPGFAASADFAVDKAPGEPCRHLGADFGCGIHDDLRDRGYPGCTAFDCLGAGQRVAQETFGGRDWRRAPETAGQMFAVFGVVRQLHELLWHVESALALDAARPLRADLGRARDATERLAAGGPDELSALDVAAHRRAVDALLLRTSALARATPPSSGSGSARRAADPTARDLRRTDRRAADRRGADPTTRDLRQADLRGADLVGRDLRRADLRTADLRGAWLIGADLRGARLDRADLIGADLRAARLDGADLGGAIFLTPPQVAAALGTPDTRLPPRIPRPPHWRPAPTPVPAPTRRSPG